MKARLIEQEYNRDNICFYNNTIKSKLIGYNKMGNQVTIIIEETGNNNIGQHLSHNSDVDVEITFKTVQTHILQ